RRRRSMELDLGGHRGKAIRRAVVQAPGRERPMSCRDAALLLVAVVEAELQPNGIGLEVDEASWTEVFWEGVRPTVEVHDQRGVPIEPVELTLAQPEDPFAGVEAVVGPMAGEAKPWEKTGEERRCARSAVVARLLHELTRRSFGCLDVVDLI